MILFPLRIFVVFLHELSHGLAAIATGGGIDHIELSVQEGGVCYTYGGFQFVILNAGYLGSLFWGAMLLIVSSRTRWDRSIVGFLGALTLIVTLVYIRSIFGFVYGLAVGSLFILAAWKLPEGFSDGLVKTIGVISCLYAVWDIASDVIFRSVPASDASALARLTFIPAIVWGIVWIAISITVTAGALIVASKGAPPAKAPKSFEALLK